MKKLPSLSDLQQVLEYSQDTGNFVWLVNRTSKRAGDVAGYKINTRGYVGIKFRGDSYRAHWLAWLYVHGEVPEGFFIDHVNGDPSDNRIANLRLATSAENSRNRSRSGQTRSNRWRGVSKNGKWFTARIRTGLEEGRKATYLGCFLDEREAAEEYMFAAIKYHGEFARLD